MAELGRWTQHIMLTPRKSRERSRPTGLAQEGTYDLSNDIVSMSDKAHKSHLPQDSEFFCSDAVEAHER